MQHARTMLFLSPASVLCCALCGCGLTDNVRPGARTVLEAVAPPDPQAAVVEASDPYRPELRYRGMKALAGQSLSGNPIASREPAISALRTNLLDADPGVRALAARSVGTFGDASDAQRVLPLLSDADADVRHEAARALQRLHDPAAIGPLLSRIRITTEPESRVRMEAATALGQYRSPQALDGLIGALDDEHLGVNLRTQESLRTLTGQDLGIDKSAWLAWLGALPEGADRFAGFAGYLAPGYERERRWYEHIPLVPQPPIEPRTLPAGYAHGS